MPASGYEPNNPCSGGGGGGGGRGGGGGTAGPTVLPGNYNVALVVNGNPVGTKQLTVVMDPGVQMTAAEHQRYNAIVEDLHTLQATGTAIAGSLNAINSQMEDIAGRISGMSNVPADVKTQFANLNRDFLAVRDRFGVPLPEPGQGGGGRGGRGGRGGGGGGDDDNVLGRAGSVKGQIMGIWETPSQTLVTQYNEVKPLLTTAIADARTLLDRARALAPRLAQYNLTLTVPPQ
jgi:hypothetical protein